MDSNCMFQGCENGNPLKSQSVAQMNACKAKTQVNEDIDGCRCLLANPSLHLENEPRHEANTTTRLGLPELPGMGGM